MRWGDGVSISLVARGSKLEILVILFEFFTGSDRLPSLDALVGNHRECTIALVTLP